MIRQIESVHRSVAAERGFKPMPHSRIEGLTRRRARVLRRDRTKAEQEMWNMLRDLKLYGARFRRETPVGPYIADFAWLSARIIVEVDGDSLETASAKLHDAKRDAFLKSQGFEILRFDNGQVVEGPDHVFAEIERRVRHLLKGHPEEPMPQ
jgi:very-short-patch-repair endonuclease